MRAGQAIFLEQARLIFAKRAPWSVVDAWAGPPALPSRAVLGPVLLWLVRCPIERCAGLQAMNLMPWTGQLLWRCRTSALRSTTTPSPDMPVASRAQVRLVGFALYWTLGFLVKWVADQSFPGAGAFLDGLLDSKYRMDGITQVLQGTFEDRRAVPGWSRRSGAVRGARAAHELDAGMLPAYRRHASAWHCSSRQVAPAC